MYIYLCFNIVFSDLITLHFCFLIVGFPYPVVGNRSDYGSSDSDKGVFGLYCEYYETGGYCDTDNLNYTETGGCMNYDGHAIISCVYRKCYTYTVIHLVILSSHEASMFYSVLYISYRTNNNTSTIWSM